MIQKGFDYQKYCTSATQALFQLITRNAKTYLEITGDLIDQSNLSRLIPQYAPDTFKKIFSPLKQDIDILLSIKAQDVIDNIPMGVEQKPFRDFLQIYLKKVENQYGVKPHIVINLIDIENMYDVVFSFETHFQKLGYRVWEKYKIKSPDLSHLLSEEGFGNDDHIPTTKKLVLIAGLTPESGKLTTAIAQMYLDQDIWIDAQYAKWEILPNFSETRSHPLNVMARASYLERAYQEEFDSTLDQLDLYERGIEKHAFLQKVIKLLKRPIPQEIPDYTLGTLDYSCFDTEELRVTAKLYVETFLKETEDEEIKTFLQGLLAELS